MWTADTKALSDPGLARGRWAQPTGLAASTRLATCISWDRGVFPLAGDGERGALSDVV